MLKAPVFLTGCEDCHANVPRGSSAAGVAANDAEPNEGCRRFGVMLLPESTFARAGDLRSVGLKASLSETSNGELAHELGELHAVVGSQHLRRLLTNHDRGCVRVAGDDVRHDARVSHAQPRDPHHP